MNESMGLELGLMEDKQLITGCHGIVTSNNLARDLCREYIPDGDKFFDAVSRYSDLCSYVLVRDGKKNPSALKMIIPFLRSFDVSDHVVYEFSKRDVRFLDGAKEMTGYLYRLLPIFISTGSYEHHMLVVSDEADFSMMNIGCPRPSFDKLEMNKREMRTMRGFAREISALRVSDRRYIDAEWKTMDDDDATLIAECDRIFLEEMPKMEFHKCYETFESVGLNEKSYALLEIRKKTEIELSSTIYVGSESSDSQALELVRDGSGLAISFNGNGHAVRACNVAVMSRDATVLSVLAEEFYDGGIESVFTLIDNWTPAKLRKRPMDENSPLRMLLGKHPRKLPVVRKVDRHNVAKVSDESEKFRTKLLG